jgi:hypothetical protein
MEVADPQLEVMHTPKAIGLAFQYLDLVVGPFRLGGGDRVVAVVQQAIAVRVQLGSKPHQESDTGGSRLDQPVVQR